jgi:signal peptidase I
MLALAAVTIAPAVRAESSPSPLEIYRNLHRLGISARPGDHAYRIPSSSMEPTLHCAKPASYCRATTADRVIVRPYVSGRRPRRGDLVAFATPPAATLRCGTGGTFIKRVIGLPGERIVEDERGFLYVDGRKLAEPYIGAAQRRDDTLRGRAWRVPQGGYFVLGDARGHSCDSRSWGAVRPAAIVGRVIAIYWPTARARRT